MKCMVSKSNLQSKVYSKRPSFQSSTSFPLEVVIKFILAVTPKESGTSKDCDVMEFIIMVSH